jgi:ribosomal protein S18 acetylase RimI-like enzyme
VTLEIRDALPGEYHRVGELTIAAYRALPVDHLWGGYDEEILDTAGRATGAHILVALLDDAIVGAVTLVDDHESRWSEWTRPGEVQFRLLAVEVEARGRGVGESLVRECLARAAGRPVIIHTTKWMDAARRMYERLGFERRPDRDVRYEVWNTREYADLPTEWIGQSFLAYAR